MKQKVFFLLLALMPCFVGIYALPYEKDFRISSNLNTVEDYQQYVGARVKFLPSSEKKWNYKGDLNSVYVIRSITGEEFNENYGSHDHNIKMNISFQQENGKKKYNVTVYQNYYAKLFGSRLSLLSMPVYLVDEYEKFKTANINKELTDTENNIKYKIVDMDYKEYPLSLSNQYLLQFSEENLTSGEKKDVFYSAIHDGDYISSLSKVEKPADASIRYGETKVIEEKGITKYSYADNIINIIIFGGSKEFSFSLKNVSDNSLKLVWNEAAFVDFEGSTSKVMHVGIKYSERESDQPSSTIIKSAKIDDVATPTVNVYYDEGWEDYYGISHNNGWKTKSMYPSKSGLDPGQLRLMLPIQIKEVVNEYVFVFDVKYKYTHPEFVGLTL